MAKLFTCDNCGNQFNSPLDEEKIIDADGIMQTYDLCAPCRAKLKKEIDSAQTKFFSKIKK